MSNEAVSARGGRGRGLLVDALQLIGLCTLAIAQPLFRLSSENPTYFAAHKVSRTGVVLFALLCVLIPAAVLFAVRVVADQLSRRTGTVVQTICVASLAAALIWSPFARATNMKPLIATILFAVLAVLIGAANLKAREVRLLLAGTVVFFPVVVLLFLFGGSMRGFIFPSFPDAAQAASKDSTPVVIVVFDELPAGSLLDAEGRIDGERFPNIGGVADTGTWYSNYSTNGIWTRVAVPIIASGIYNGAFVPGDRPPITANYPRSLFTMLSGSRQMHVSELATQVCPASICAATSADDMSAKTLLADTSILYLHALLPGSMTVAVPPVTNTWSGFLRSKEFVPSYFQRMPAPLRAVATRIFTPLAPANERGEVTRFQEFTEAIGDYDDSALHYLHVKLPHRPWSLLPSLQTHRRPKVRKGAVDIVPDVDARGVDEIAWPDDTVSADAALQQHLLQVQGVDTLLGQLIDELKERGTWDETLFVATADHGISFHPGESKRIDTRPTAEDVLRTPLLIKYPKQRKGRVDDRDAQAIDIVPTIADVLDVDAPWPLTGTSLLRRAPERERVVNSADRVKTYPSDLGRFRSLPVQIERLFGSGDDDADDLYRFGPFGDLVGTKAPRTVDRSSVTAALDDPSALRKVDPDAPAVPTRVSASIVGPAAREGWVAVALNGRIAGLGAMRERRRGRWIVETLVSPQYLREGRNELRLFVVTDDGDLEEMSLVGGSRARRQRGG